MNLKIYIFFNDNLKKNDIIPIRKNNLKGEYNNTLYNTVNSDAFFSIFIITSISENDYLGRNDKRTYDE